MTKRLVFSILMVLALTAGAAYAQSSLNGVPPGPTQQQEPGLTNNNLPNPGNPVPTPEAQAQQQPLQEQGTVEGTATESTTGSLDTTTSTTTTGTTETEVDTTVDTTTDTGSLSDTDTLPSTASKLPLVGLIGLLALAAAFAVRRF